MGGLAPANEQMLPPRTLDGAQLLNVAPDLAIHPRFGFHRQHIPQGLDLRAAAVPGETKLRHPRAAGLLNDLAAEAHVDGFVADGRNEGGFQPRMQGHFVQVVLLAKMSSWLKSLPKTLQ